MLIWTNTDIVVIVLDFELRSEFSLLDGKVGKDIIFFICWYHWVDTNILAHIDNKGKDILILGKGPTQGLDDTMFSRSSIFN